MRRFNFPSRGLSHESEPDPVIRARIARRHDPG